MMNDTWGIGLAVTSSTAGEKSLGMFLVVEFRHRLQVRVSNQVVENINFLRTQWLAFLASHHQYTMELLGALNSVIYITSGSPESRDYQNPVSRSKISGR